MKSKEGSSKEGRKTEPIHKGLEKRYTPKLRIPQSLEREEGGGARQKRIVGNGRTQATATSPARGEGGGDNVGIVDKSTTQKLQFNSMPQYQWPLLYQN